MWGKIGGVPKGVIEPCAQIAIGKESSTRSMEARFDSDHLAFERMVDPLEQQNRDQGCPRSECARAFSTLVPTKLFTPLEVPASGL